MTAGETTVRSGRPARSIGAAALARMSPQHRALLAQQPWLLWFALAALVLPTIVRLAQQTWSEEQGAHGFIVLGTGAWLLAIRRKAVFAAARPGPVVVPALVFVASALVYVFSRAVGWLGFESLAVYAIVLAVLVYHAGYAALRTIWFPLVYLMFMLPQPQFITLPLSRELKLHISQSAVELLSSLGYRVARGGVVIYIDQYQLLVARACSGLNSLIGLSAVGAFYAYARYRGQWSQAWPLLISTPLIAVLANFLRVLILVLITHYFGNAVAQGFIHGAAGVFMAFVSITGIVGLDLALSSVRQPSRAAANG
jgi:exosortase